MKDPSKQATSLILAIGCIACLCLNVAYANQVISPMPSQGRVLTGNVSQNELIDNLEKVGIKCVIQDGKPPSLFVEQVRMGSSAYYAGISKGDAIIDLKQAGADMFSLTIKREGRIYQSNLKALSGQIASSTLQGNTKNTLLTGAAKNSLLTGNATEQGLKGSISEKPEEKDEPEKKLIPYDVELIIDTTGSMNEVDGTGNLSKFEWCHDQVRNLAESLDPYNKTITITTFNNAFETMENCTPDAVEQIYAGIHPRGGTDLVDPLTARLNSAINRHRTGGHPTLIAVITDGEPNIPADPHVVNEAIIDATCRMPEPDEVVLTFLQIGDTFVGRDFCLGLDNHLINEGARYDIVDTKTFAELKREGLVNALIDAVVESKSTRLAKAGAHAAHLSGNRGAAGRSASNRLDDLQKQRKDIERQLLGK